MDENEVNADELGEELEEEPGEEIITPAWQTEEHHLDERALRLQATLSLRPQGMAYHAGIDLGWACEPRQVLVPVYDRIERAPGSFCDDPHEALELLADYHNLKGQVHRQLGVAC